MANVQIEGLAATKRERNPGSSKNRRPRKNAYRPVPLQCRVRKRSWRTGETATNPSATLHRETRNRHGQKSPPEPSRLAVTADHATRQNRGGCGKIGAPHPAKTTCPESRTSIGSPRCPPRGRSAQADSEPKQRAEPSTPNVQIEGLAVTKRDRSPGSSKNRRPQRERLSASPARMQG